MKTDIVEIWRTVKCCDYTYDGLYECSNLGGLRSVDKISQRGFKLKGKSIKPSSVRGYLRCVLHDHYGNRRQFCVHQLIAFTFPEICGNWFEGAQIDHKDGNPQNNCATNLWWCTAKQNANNPITHERLVKRVQSEEFRTHQSEIQIGKKLSDETRLKLSIANKGRISPNKGKTLSDEYKEKIRISCNKIAKKVQQFTTDGEFVAEYDSIRDAARKTNINRTGIKRCCEGDKWYKKSGGFVWKYKAQ